MRNAPILSLVLVVAVLAAPACKKEEASSKEPAGPSTSGSETGRAARYEIETEEGKAVYETDGKGRTTVTAPGEKWEIDERAGTASLTAEGKTITAAEGKLPEGFPLPLMEGARIDTSVDAGDGYMVVFLVPAPVKEVGDYYAKVFEEKGGKPNRTDMSGDNEGVLLNATIEGKKVGLMASREPGENATKAILTWNTEM